MAQSRTNLRIAVGLAVCMAAAALAAFLLPPRQKVEEAARRAADSRTKEKSDSWHADFVSGDSTAIVPTLDISVPEKKSIVWCSSFVLAWKAAIRDLTKEPLRVANVGDLDARLNRAEQSETDLVPGTYYTKAGLIKDGIQPLIAMEMKHLFPAVPVQEEAVTPFPPHVAVAYAYLQAHLAYTHAFQDSNDPLKFTDSSGIKTSVRSFGVPRSYVDADGISFRGQVRVLWQTKSRDQFAVDLCANSTPCQIILAKMARKESLAETLRDLEAKTENLPFSASRLGPEDILLVPTIKLRVQHHFRELEGEDKIVNNAALANTYIGTALQAIEFELDRKGARLASEAVLLFDNGGPHLYLFDQPFLIVMKKRGAAHPFLVLWVDNAELLSRM